MLFQIDVSAKTAREVPSSSLTTLGLRERYDLQEWVLHTPGILGEELLVITSEYAGFDRTAERLDVLAMDREGVLTVIELKRSAVGTAAELQALRYAAYCSTLRLADVAEMLAQYATRRSGLTVTPAEADARIRAFVGDPEFTEFGDRPRIILGAEAFSPEILATVVWLLTFGLTITCVQLRPYAVDGRLFLDSTVLVPLRETREFQIRRAVKAAGAPRAPAPEFATAEEFLAAASPDVQPLLARLRDAILANADVREEVFKTVLGYRRGDTREWVTWLQHTRYEARVALPPEVDVDPELYVRPGSGGWSIVRARTPAEVAEVLARLPIAGVEPSAGAVG